MCVVVQKQWLQRKYALGSSGPDSSYQNTKAFAYTCTNEKKNMGICVTGASRMRRYQEK